MPKGKISSDFVFRNQLSQKYYKKCLILRKKNQLWLYCKYSDFFLGIYLEIITIL